MTDFAQLVERWRAGDRSAEAELMKQLYPALRALAAKNIQRQGQQLTLSPTDLAHEAYLRLAELTQVHWKSQAHCMAFIATMVRHVIIDYLRERAADKRHGGKVAIALSDLDPALATEHDLFSWLKINDALTELELIDPDCAKVVQMKLFSDLGAEQIAEACDTSLATVGRHWRFAKAWLADAIATD